jgi:hypothetical protein
MVVAVLAAIGGFMAGLRHLDVVARRQIGPRDRYEVRVADIECDTPVGMDRLVFLAEVRYVGNLPERVHVLTDDDRVRLTASFLLHPWVEGVGDVRVEQPGRVRVELRFRVPFLAVPTVGGGVRVVDRSGYLLPATPIHVDMVELVNRVPDPLTAVGQVWSDPVVHRAVELAKVYQPRRLEKTAEGWRLTRHDGTALVVGE